MAVRSAILTLLFIAASSFGPAHADTGENADWACWYPGGHQINCVLIQAASSLGGTVVEPLAAVPVSRGRPMPKTVSQVQAGSADLYGQVVRIPLMSEPNDPVLVQQLAQFTVCGTTPTCRMTFTRNAQEVVLLQDQSSSLR